MFALVDCNNFFVSCERAFDPKLEDKPVAILSNNDGCFISRSNEVKLLGIPMGAPYFKYKNICQSKGIKVFSSNFRLYGDMSARVMSILKELVPEVEVYSIDEAFLKIDKIPLIDRVDFCENIRIKIKQWIGLPVSIGIGPSKTLAKVANMVAKKNNLGVFDISSKAVQQQILSDLDIGEVWGVGKNISVSLQRIGINKASELRDADPKMIRKLYGVIGEKKVYELQGISCLRLEIDLNPKKSILVSRSFGKPLTEIEDVSEALSHYAATATAKLRKDDMKLQGICVFLTTNWHRKDQIYYNNHANFYFDLATDNTMQIGYCARQLLHKLFKPGYIYKKVGIILLNLISNSYSQGSLLSSTAQEEQNSKLMQTMDNINNKMGKNTIFLASEGIKRDWQMKSCDRSPNYTSNWEQLLNVK